MVSILPCCSLAKARYRENVWSTENTIDARDGRWTPGDACPTSAPKVQGAQMVLKPVGVLYLPTIIVGADLHSVKEPSTGQKFTPPTFALILEGGESVWEQRM